MEVLIQEVGSQLAKANGEMRRLFHGRGQCFSGFEFLVVDWFPPVAVIRIYEAVPDEQVRGILDALSSFSGVQGVVLQKRIAGVSASSEVVWGDVPSELVGVENALKYHIRPLAAQNSGLFLDMRAGRRWVQQHARHKKVLNLFAYTCGFSVAAMAGGADSVVNLDMAKGAMSTGRQNHRLNGLDQPNVRFLTHDLFNSWGKLKRMGPYELVIIDPPSFQKGSFVAEFDYKKVIRRLPDLVAEGGMVLACHNDPTVDLNFLIDEMAEHCPSLELLERIENPEDFPDMFPEKGLKTLLFHRGI